MTEVRARQVEPSGGVTAAVAVVQEPLRVRRPFDRVVRVGFDLARGVATVTDEAAGGHDVAA